MAFWYSLRRSQIALNLRLLRKRAESEESLRKQRDAATTKEVAQTKESEAKTASTYVETVRKLVPIIALGYGLIAAFVYFFISANFFPSGVTTGDTLLFVFVAMGYALLSLLFIAFGFLIAALPSVAYEAELIKTKKAANKPNTAIHLFLGSAFIPFGIYFAWKGVQFFSPSSQFNFSFGFIACLLGAAICYLNALRLGGDLSVRYGIPGALHSACDALFDSLFYCTILGFGWFLCLTLMYFTHLSGIFLIACMFLSSFAAWLAISKIDTTIGKPQNPVATRVRTLLLTIALMIPLMFDMTQGHGKLVSYVFSGLGLRSENATVRLTGAGLSAVKDAAHNLGANLAICFDEDGNATVSPVKVIWHGMGKRSLVSIPTYVNGSTEEKSTELEISADELRLIRGNSSKCHDLRSRVFFQSNKADIPQADQMTAVIQDAVQAIKSVKAMPCEIPKPNKLADRCNWRLSRIVASGSADPMPKSDGGNEVLAKSRAQQVIANIVQNEPLKTLALKNDATICESESLGSRTTVQKQCPFSGDKAALQECHASNRNVRVRLLFEAQPIDSKLPIGASAVDSCVQQD